MKVLFNCSTTDSIGFTSHSEKGIKAVGKTMLLWKGKSSYWEGCNYVSIDMSEYCSLNSAAHSHNILLNLFLRMR